MKDIVRVLWVLWVMLVFWLAFLHLMTPEVPVMVDGKRSIPGKLSPGSYWQEDKQFDHGIDFNNIRDPFRRMK